LGQGDRAEVRLNIFGEIVLAIEMGEDPVDLLKTIHLTLCESIVMASYWMSRLQSRP
jgi:hypothetical protein